MKNKRPVKKIITYSLIIFLVIIILLFILLNFFIPNDSVKEGFWFTVNGKITTDVNDSSNYPEYVSAYYPYYNLRQLSRANTIELAKIDWENNIGSYSLTAWIPIEMNIILTVKSDGCNHETIYISKDDNLRDINLLYDEKLCHDTLNIPEKREELIDKARGLLDRTFTEISELQIPKTEAEKIRADNNRGREELEESGNVKEINQSLIHAYNAFWLGWRVDYELEIWKLQQCVEESSKLLVNNELCIILPYEAKIDLLDSARVYNGTENSWILREEVHDVNTIEEAKNNVQSIYQERSKIREEVQECNNALDIARKSSENQYGICKTRDSISSLLKWAEALALICLGILISYPIREWIEK
ncbi:hypothetical protein HYT55_02980 [Candidatus Woesearchaeota archaeon]|nr:hypothetical protein [Candidatus Woesearchaeota archaeon]